MFKWALTLDALIYLTEVVATVTHYGVMVNGRISVGLVILCVRLWVVQNDRTFLIQLGQARAAGNVNGLFR